MSASPRGSRTPAGPCGPPRIEGYRFGSVTVAGRVYTRDVVIRREGVLPGWWRREGHGLCPEDLAGAVEPRPDVLVIGCGASGALTVPGETRRWIEEQGIELVALPTGEACEKYNELAEARRVVAGLHLTC